MEGDIFIQIFVGLLESGEERFGNYLQGIKYFFDVPAGYWRLQSRSSALPAAASA